MLLRERKHTLSESHLEILAVMKDGKTYRPITLGERIGIDGNCSAWASPKCISLVQKRLLKKIGRGSYQITQRGITTIVNSPATPAITNTGYLKQEFLLKMNDLIARGLHVEIIVYRPNGSRVTTLSLPHKTV